MGVGGWGLGVGGWGLGFGVWGLGLVVWVLGFRVLTCVVQVEEATDDVVRGCEGGGGGEGERSEL